jgi:MFS family permease
MTIEETGGIAAMSRPGLLERWRDWLGIAVMVTSAPSLALIFTATGPVLPMIAKHFAAVGQAVFTIPGLGLTIDGPFYAQLMTTVPSIGLMLGGGPTGFAIDRFGVRRVLLCAMIAFAALGSAGFYIDNAFWLLASRLALGFAAIAYASATVWLIGGRFNDTQRARVLSYRNILAGIGGMTSILLSGYIAELFGWHAVFALFLIPLLLFPAAVFAIAPSAADLKPKAHASRESLAFLWPVFLTVVFLAIVMMMNAAQLSFLLVESGITMPKAQSHVIVAGSTLTMLGSILYSELGPRLGLRASNAIPALLLGVGCVLIGLSRDALLATIGAGVVGTGAGWVIPHFSRLILGRSPVAARGRAVGLFYSCIYGGDLINPFVVRPFALAFGIHRTFVIIGIIVSLGAVVIFLPKERGQRAVE